MTGPASSGSPISPSAGSPISPSAGSPAPSIPAEVLSVWQAALAAEHAAIFGYGALGPRLGPVDTDLARADEAAHRLLRGSTARALTSAGADPVASRGDYPLPFAIDSGLAARRLALRLESACASAWRYLLANAATETGSLPSLRAAAQTALTASAVRAMKWRALIDPSTPTEAFPGI
ncbi:MAG: hypothetical protein JWM76_1807 [Pseudonocardiales bacterium]|nr:hypothetical protein [Pseudonocardiales bacterium]